MESRLEVRGGSRRPYRPPQIETRKVLVANLFSGSQPGELAYGGFRRPSPQK